MAKRIISNPDICNGTPVFEGTRITVQTVLEFLAAGDSISEVVNEYPSLDEADICSCFGYASKAMSNHYELTAI